MVLDMNATTDHSGLWYCQKCKTWIDAERPKCSFCGAPNPDASVAAKVPDTAEQKLTASLHTAIEKMSYGQKVKTWRWLEDNVI